MEGLERWQNNQMKKMGIGRLGLIFFMIGGMLFVVLRSGQATYLVIQVVLLFSALFFGYRFGPGAGAIAGSISGIMLSLVSGEAAQIGILCLLGIFSGAFRSLGRMASVTACAAAAFGVGIVYSPAILFQTMESVLAVGVVFLLLPEKLTCPQKQNFLKEDCGFNEQESIPVWQAAVEDMAGEGLPALAQTFSQLSSMYREEDVAIHLKLTGACVILNCVSFCQNNFLSVRRCFWKQSGRCRKKKNCLELCVRIWKRSCYGQV